MWRALKHFSLTLQCLEWVRVVQEVQSCIVLYRCLVKKCLVPMERYLVASCDVKVTAEKLFTVQQHCKTSKHVKCLSRLSTNDSRQSLLFKNSSANSSSSTNNGSQFSKDLCQWMASSNISLEKLHNQHFRKFLEIYTCHPIPSESMKKKFSLYTLHKIRTSVADDKIWVSLGETSDIPGRYIANVIVGTLKQD
jgi:hypothetical protein